MNKRAHILIIFLFLGMVSHCISDRLPDEVPENQLFSVSSMIDATGLFEDTTTLDWVLAGTGASARKSTRTSASTVPGGTMAQINTLQNLGAIVTYHESPVPGTYDLDSITVPDYAEGNALPSGWPASTLGGFVDYLGTHGYDTSNTHVDNSITDEMLKPSQEIAIVNYRDHIFSNGGKISENKNFNFDSQNQGKGLNNIEVEKVFTYSSTEGAHLVGEESMVLNVAGSWQPSTNNIRCIFSIEDNPILPAFCNVVSAKSALINLNSGQISTKAQVRSVAKQADVPAELNYQIALTPDTNSGSGFAEGTITTNFAGSIMEARDNLTSTYNKTAAENQWKDSTSVTGGIKNFQKSFSYLSGFELS